MEIGIALVIMLIICMVALTIVQALAWYERYSAKWHHEMMLESYADGWDAACKTLREQVEGNPDND